MILTVKSVSLLDIEVVTVVARALLRQEIVIFKCFHCASFHGEADFVFRNNIRFPLLVPNDAIVLFYVILLDFAV